MIFCWNCGRKQTVEKKARSRGNGQGTVYKLPNGKYRAVITTGYKMNSDGKRKRLTRSKTFALKKDAVLALAELLKEPTGAEKKKEPTFRELYEQWLPTHKAGKDTLNCYKAAYKYFSDIADMRISEIDVDDLQDCVDDCPKGKRTRQNMKAMCGLVYKYGIPRHVIPDNLNLSQFIRVGGEDAPDRPAFSDTQIESIRKLIGRVDGAEQVYCLIYTGFRPSEFLSLDVTDFNAAEMTLTGGAKTEAGRGRTVTISPKISAIIKKAAAGRTGGALFSDGDGNRYTLKHWTESVFYAVLDAAGIDNPVVKIGGDVERHLYTPHCCRHTFANLMKRVDAPALDKQKLIGHASEQQLKYYQSADADDLRRITDFI